MGGNIVGGVTSANSLNNATPADVIGNKQDSHTADSIYALTHTLNDHAHKEQRVYPRLTNPITLTKAAGAWAAFPTPTEIVPVNGITSDFDIHFVTVSSISTNGSYDLELYRGLGGAEIFIGAVTFVRSTNKDQAALREQTVVIPANTRISAALSSSNAAADTADIKLEYHLY